MDTKEVVTILNNLTINDKLDIRERAAINETLFFLSRIEHRGEQQYDFQGLPVKQLTMKELRKFVRDNGALNDDVKLLVLEVLTYVFLKMKMEKKKYKFGFSYGT